MDPSVGFAQEPDDMFPSDYHPSTIEVNDFLYLNSLDIHGAKLTTEGVRAAKEASTIPTQPMPMADFVEPLISFTMPDYSQQTLPNSSTLDLNMPDDDWLAAIDDLGVNSVPMGEEKTAPFVFGLGNNLFSTEQPAYYPASDRNTSQLYNSSFAAFQPAPIAPMASQHKRSIGTSLIGFSGHRDYQPTPPSLNTSISTLPVEPLTPSPGPASAEPFGDVQEPILESKVTGFSPGQPEKSAEHPWVRKTGAKSIGGATRTGKINQYRSQDFYQPSRRINSNFWQASSGVKFEYNQWGELDGSTMTLSAREMRYFLFENPARLTLWIQTCPADSARRYNTLGSSRCRFKDCPARVYRNTIGVGILRVAIDEAYQSGEAQRDPHHVAGYIHLYCAERFLDWRAVCAQLDVRADERVFATEPNRRWGASLSKFPGMSEVARRFIKYARHDAQNGTQLLETKFPNYPAHVAPFRAPKIHANTLTCAMMKTKMDRMNAHRRKQLQSRGEKDSHQTRNLGDLEQAVNDRRATAIAKKRKWLADQADEDEESVAESAAASQADAVESSSALDLSRTATPDLSSFNTATATQADTNAAPETARPTKRIRYINTAAANAISTPTTPSRSLRSADRAKHESPDTLAVEQDSPLDQQARQSAIRLIEAEAGKPSNQRQTRASTRTGKKSKLVSYRSDSEDEDDASN